MWPRLNLRALRFGKSDLPKCGPMVKKQHRASESSQRSSWASFGMPTFSSESQEEGDKGMAGDDALAEKDEAGVAITVKKSKAVCHPPCLVSRLLL